MDFDKILNQIKDQKKSFDSLSIHVNKLHDSHREELNKMMPNFYNDIKKMVKDVDFNGVKAKNREVLSKIKDKEDADKRNNNGEKSI